MLDGILELKINKRLLLLCLTAPLLIYGAFWLRHRLSHRPDIMLAHAMKDPRAKALDAEVAARQKAVAANPKDVQARWDLTASYQRIGLLDLAAEQVEEIIKLEPENQNAATSLGDAYLLLRQTEKAEAAYLNVTKRWPKLTAGWQGLSAARYQRRDYRGAIQAIRTAVKLEPRNDNHRYILATSIIQGVQESPTPQVYGPLLAAARSDLLKLVKTWPMPGEIHFRLGGIAGLLGDNAGAVKHLREAVKAMPTRPDVIIQLAESLIASGNRQEAAKIADDALAKGLKAAPLYDIRGRLYQGSTDPAVRQKAIAMFEEAVKLNPNHPRYLERLGGELARVNRLEEARKALERALLLNPERAFPYQQLSAVYTRLGDTQRASNAAKMATQMVYNEQQLRRLEELSMSEPENLNLQLVLGDRYRDLKMTSAAREKYLIALQLQPGNKRAQDGLKALDAAEKPSEVAATP